MNCYVTTPIYYVNAQPHLGHAYTTIVADAYSRYRRLRGDDVRFQTGTDEHGDKIAAAAAEAGESPQAYVDRISALFRDSWPALSIAPDHFIRTTDPSHRAAVQQILQKIHDQGDIVFSEYSGLYCKGCERFLTEKELVDGLCPDHRKAPEPIAEKNYFFRMSRYQDWLIDHIQSNPEFITPERYRNEVLSFLKEPLEDLCISRPTTRLTWGIPLPFDPSFVTYVWFDALINYVTGLGYTPGGMSDLFDRYWPVAEHVIAKDILKPHAIYWPTMLKAMGVAPFKKLHVHGFWNVNDTKMSKSIGNVVRPQQMIDDFGVDAVRYFLLREMSFGVDASYSEEAVVGRQNADLANDLGNLFARSLAMVAKFAGSRVPEPGEMTDLDRELAAAAERMLAAFGEHMDTFAFSRALQEVWDVVGMANRYIVSNAPWELAKDPARRGRLRQVIHVLIETLRLIALPLHAILPETARKMQQSLGLAENPSLSGHGRWGGVLVPGTEVHPGQALFPRIEKKTGDGGSPSSVPVPKDPTPAKAIAPQPVVPAAGQDSVTYDEFKRFEFRVATIVAAERVPKSDRLLKLTVQAPEPRTVVAGIAEQYAPEDVVGKQVILLANLKPTKLMGILSEGMVLAARDGERLVLSTVSAPVAAGSRVA